MVKIWKLLILFTLLLQFTTARAVDQVNYAAGPSDIADIAAARVGLQWDWPSLWQPADNWHVTGYWELSYAFMLSWKNASQSPHVFALTPVFRWQRMTPYESSSVMPFLELGFGVSLFTNKRADKRKLSLFEFEDRAGIGLYFGEKQQYEAKYVFMHYSNAGLSKPNSGINIHWLSFGYRF